MQVVGCSSKIIRVCRVRCEDSQYFEERFSDCGEYDFSMLHCPEKIQVCDFSTTFSMDNRSWPSLFFYPWSIF